LYGETFVVFQHSNSKKKKRKTSAILKKEKECEIHTHDVCQTRTEKIVQMPKEIRWNFLVRHLYFLQILNYSQYTKKINFEILKYKNAMYNVQSYHSIPVFHSNQVYSNYLIMSDDNQPKIHFSCADWGRIEEIFAVQTFVPPALPTDPLVIVDDSTTDDDDNEDILLNQSYRSRSSSITPAELDVLMSDGDVDEFIANPASHRSLTHDFYNEVHWPNLFAVQNYIRDIKRPEGLNGRLYRPLQPLATITDPVPTPAPRTPLRRLLEEFIHMIGFVVHVNSTICEHVIFLGLFMFVEYVFRKLFR
jgi:hypothetical protein